MAEAKLGVTGPAKEAGDPRRWWILSAVGLGTILGPLDGSIVNIALPVITSALHAPLTTAEWVVVAYLLVISSLLLMWGRLADLYGHRTVYLTGFWVFALGSALAGLAPNMGVLIAFRALQAAGAGMMMASGPAIITDVFPAHERGRALGLNAMVVAIGLATGPVAGGLLTRYLGWRWIFYVNVPIALVGILWGARVLPRGATRRREQGLPNPAEAAAASGETFDALGAGLLLAGLGSVLLVLSQGERWGWTSAPALGLAAAGAAFLAAFWRVEQQAPSPMVDLRLFRDRTFVLANVSGLLNYMAQFSVTFLMPFYLQYVLRLSPDRAGLVMLGFPAVTVVVAPIAGYLSDRMPATLLTATGMAILAAGVWQASQVWAGQSPFQVFLKLGVVGLGSALFQSPNNNTIMGSVPRSRLGVAGGMLASMRNIGMVLGIAVSSAVFTARAGAAIELAAGSRASFLKGFHDAMAVGTILAAIGVLTSLLATTGRRGQRLQPVRERAAGPVHLAGE